MGKNFKKNPLFPRATGRAASAARRQWNDTNSKKAIDQVKTALSGNSLRSGASTAIDFALRSWQQTSRFSQEALHSIGRTDFGGMIREVQRYARMGGAMGRMIAELLGTLGPLGTLIKSLISSPARERKSGLQGDVQSALEFLDAVAPQTLSGPGRQRARAATGRSVSTIEEQVAAAKDFLETQGYQVKSPQDLRREDKKPTYPGGVPTETKRGTPRRVVDLNIDGANRRFPVTHPIITKAYVMANSSNVHSFSYDIDRFKLFIRFHASGKQGRGKGTLYAYNAVPPKMFLSLMEAPSKGTWVWDNLRIRGTVSGHQKDYELVAFTGGYLPRKATMTAEGETYLQREMPAYNVGSKQFHTVKSALPTQLVRGAINRGTPNRGKPNRGR